MAADEAGHDAEIDVAARQHDARRAVAQPGRGRRHRRHADRAGSLDVQLGPLHQQHHRVGDGILVDGHDLVDPVLDERAGELAGVLDGDAVGERDDRSVGAARRRGTGAHRGLDADHPDVGSSDLTAIAIARRQAAAAERHDHAGQVGEVLDELEAERALAGDDHRVVERVAERHAGVRCPRLGGGQRLV